MKKKFLAAVLAGIMVIATAAGCGNPKVTLGQYKGLELTDITQEELEEEMAAVLESYAELVEVDRASKEGDTVNIDYVGKLDDVAFDGGSDEDYDLELGSDSFIDGFEDGLIGLTAGTTVDLNLTFPEPYENNPDLAGKEVVFTVTVNAVKEEQVPELTDEFVQEKLSDFGSTVEEIWQVLKEEMQYETFYSQINTALLESCTVKNMDDDEIIINAQSVVEQYTQMATYYGYYYSLTAEQALYYFWGFESTEALQNWAKEYCTKSMKWQLILQEIAKTEGIEITDEIYEEKIADMAKEYDYEDDVDGFVEKYTKEKITQQMLIDEVIDFIIDEATVVEPKSEE